MTASRTTLPTGTITFLFTDIEGSTHFVHALGTARWSPVLQRHRELVRSALVAHEGHEVQTEGDSFFIAFEHAADALATAVLAQRILSAEPWPADAPIRVRMGLHTGDGTLDSDGGYVGPDVHRAARVAAAGHGGQVLVSSSTAPLVGASLPSGVALRDLQEHRLKDLRPERLYDLVIDGLPAEFPPIRSLDLRPNNLPTQLTSFVGRERELGETRSLLEETRLLTLTGPGGTGKTRLALQLAAGAADRYTGGVFFVALAPIRDPALVPTTIAHALGISEDPARSTIDLLAHELAGRRILLVLDNVEQVVTAASHVADLLRRLPDLSAIATTRAPLRISGEQEYPVPGLPAPRDPSRLAPLERESLAHFALPSDPDALLAYEAVRLFVSRAVAVRPDFHLTPQNAPVVAAICARLEGMPLAIELAAARLRILAPGAILDRLGGQLDLLAAGARDLPERQRTLRGAIAWSHELLDPPCRRLFERLSVFVGGAGLAEAEAVCGPASELGQDVLGGLAALVDQSLVRVDEADAEPRYVMHEPIREFAVERLEMAGETDELRTRHARIFAEVVTRAAPELAGRDQRRWLDRLERDHDNIRAALDCAIARPLPGAAMTIAARAWRFWQKRGHLREARRRIADVLSQRWSADDRVLRVRLLEAAGGVEYWHGSNATAAPFYDEALAISREIGDPAEISNALYNAAVGRFVGGWSERAPEALPMLEDALALARQAGDRHGEANVLWGIGTYRYFLGENADAVAYLERALELFPETGDVTMESWSKHQLGGSLLKLGELDRAERLLAEAIHLFHGVGDLSGVTLALHDLSSIAAARGDLPRAARLAGAAAKLEKTSGAELARVVEETFELATRPSAARILTGDELARFASEGQALTLDEIVAYALDTTTSSVEQKPDR